MSQKLKNELSSKIAILPEIVNNSVSLAEVAKYFGFSNHGRNTSVIREFLTENHIDYSHFGFNGKRKISLEKTCPQCGKVFICANSRDGRNKVTCSHSCANKYFSAKQLAGRSVLVDSKYNNEKMYKEILLKKILSRGLPIKCVVCDETEVLDVHHVDGDNLNNDENNLVYLCPTHHQALHRYNSEKVSDAIVSHLDMCDTIEVSDS